MQIDIHKHLKALGFQSGDSPDREKLKDRWRELCKEHHPDKGGNSEKFKQVMHAYKMLTDPSYQREESETARGMKGDLNLRIQVPISFEDAFFGRSVVVSFNQVELDATFKPVVKERQEIFTLCVKVPAGSCDGFEHTAEEKGLKCGEHVGTAHILFKPLRHPKFQINGANVMSAERVPLDIMLKGGTIEVITMYGMKTVRIPPGSQPGESIQIKSCGVMQAGDHVIQIEPIYPNKQDLKKDAWKSLGIDWTSEKEEIDRDAHFEAMFAKFRQQTIYGIRENETSTEDEESL